MFKSPHENETHLTEVLHPTDPRCNALDMKAAKVSEISGLMKRGAFKVMKLKDVPDKANVLTGRRFVLAYKNGDNGERKAKARYVIGGHRDKYKDLMVHNSKTLQPHSIILLLALTSMLNFDLWTSDVSQTYLQSSLPLSRQVYIKRPVEEFGLAEDECLQLLLPLYGLTESGDYWFYTMDEHHRVDLKMTPFRLDSTIYFLRRGDSLIGLSGAYVDDFIRSGNKVFKELESLSNEKFNVRDNMKLPCTFSGFRIDRNEKGELIINQREYLRQLEELQSNATFSEFRSMRMKLAWLSHSRPDCLLEISHLAQVTDKQFSSSKVPVVRCLNKAVKFAKKHQLSLVVKKLDRASLRIIGYSDASFANNDDLTTQLGYILFLGDKFGNVVPTYFKSYKARRVVNSAMAGEMIAFSDLFDTSVAIASDLQTCLRKKIPIQLLTDSKSLFDVISKDTRTSQKRTNIEIAVAREGFKDRFISDIEFVRSTSNVADGLTKRMIQAQLCNILLTETLDVIDLLNFEKFWTWAGKRCIFSVTSYMQKRVEIWIIFVIGIRRKSLGHNYK